MRPLETDSQTIGKVFGRLTVLRRSHRGPAGVTFWLCKCECGQEIATPLFPLRSGRTKTCGCYGKKRIGTFNKTHGLSHRREYTIWCGIKARCYNKSNRSYPRYGGRGVTVCQRWRESFDAFIADVGWPPTDRFYTLDRKDGTKGYEPGNVRWATYDQQANNTRSNKRLTAFGRTQTIAQWARETGLHYRLISARLAAGWPHERILTEKSKSGPRKKQIEYEEPHNWVI